MSDPARKSDMVHVHKPDVQLPEVVVPQGIGVSAENLSMIIAGSQMKVDQMLADISEKLAAVEARATYREKIVITRDAIQIEREATMAKDRKY